MYSFSPCFIIRAVKLYWRTMINLSNILSDCSGADLTKDSKLVGFTRGNTARILYVRDLNQVAEFTFPEEVTQILFSEDCLKFLVLNKEGTTLYARAILDKTFEAKITDSELGIVNALWVPDSCQILTFSKLNIKATVYNLLDSKQYIIRWPKSSEGCYAFSHNRKFLAVAEKREGKDYVGIYYCMNWRLVSYFQAETVDLSLLSWTQNDSCIILADHSINFGIYAYAPTDAMVFKEKDAGCLGAKQIDFSENGNYMAILTYDEKLKIYNLVSWRLVITVDLKPTDGTNFFLEMEDPARPPIHSSVAKKFDKVNSFKMDAPLSLDAKKEGKAELRWSGTGRYIAVKMEKYPKYLFIFELLTMEVHSIIVVNKNDELKTCGWDSQDNLFFCWGNAAFGMWNPEVIGALNPGYSKPFKVTSFVFTFDKKTLLLKSGKNYCLYYPEQSVMRRNRQDERITETSYHHQYSGREESTLGGPRKVDLGSLDSSRRMTDARTQDLIDVYDRRNTPEKNKFDSIETFGRRGPDSNPSFGSSGHKFED